MSAWILPLLASCAPEIGLVEAEPDDIEVWPSPLVLERGAGCTEHTLEADGDAVLGGAWWLASEGEQEAVALPDIVALPTPFAIGVLYCPPDDTPSAGWIVLSFDDGRTRAVPAMEPR